MKAIINKEDHAKCTLIIEEADLANMTVVLDTDSGKYTMNLGKILAKVTKGAIDRIEKEKREKENAEKNSEETAGEKETETTEEESSSSEPEA